MLFSEDFGGNLEKYPCKVGLSSSICVKRSPVLDVFFCTFLRFFENYRFRRKRRFAPVPTRLIQLEDNNTECWCRNTLQILNLQHSFQNQCFFRDSHKVNEFSKLTSNCSCKLENCLFARHSRNCCVLATVTAKILHRNQRF